MKNQFLQIWFLASLFLFFSLPILAANSLDVVINEIAWMGTEISYNDEWIELYNNTENTINLNGWILKAVDGTPEIIFSGTIRANSFYLLERTDDTTVPGISADQIYKGALSNEGENLELYDNFGNLIDSVNCSSGWVAGDNSTKQTMERKSGTGPGSDPGNWQTSQNPGGTPKAINSVIVKPSPEESVKKPELEPKEESQPESPAEPEKFAKPQTQQRIHPTGIVINEILPSPEGPDAEDEWIEIFNQNDFEIDLSGWKVADTAGKTTAFTFPKGTIINKKSFLVLSRPTTKIILNNEGDGILLFQPNGDMVDSLTYEKAPQGQSYNRTKDGWLWSSILTPGSENVIPAPKPEKEKSEVKPQKSEERLAAVGEQTKLTNLLFVFLVAFILAAFSGIIIFILKRKIKKVIIK